METTKIISNADLYEIINTIFNNNMEKYLAVRDIAFKNGVSSLLWSHFRCRYINGVIYSDVRVKILYFIDNYEKIKNLTI
jgi:uncharacterized alpha/beta hydrolase family protein